MPFVEVDIVFHALDTNTQKITQWVVYDVQPTGPSIVVAIYYDENLAIRQAQFLQDNHGGDHHVVKVKTSVKHVWG